MEDRRAYRAANDTIHDILPDVTPVDVDDERLKQYNKLVESAAGNRDDQNAANLLTFNEWVVQVAATHPNIANNIAIATAKGDNDQANRLLMLWFLGNQALTVDPQTAAKLRVAVANNDVEGGTKVWEADRRADFERTTGETWSDDPAVRQTIRDEQQAEQEKSVQEQFLQYTGQERPDDPDEATRIWEAKTAEIVQRNITGLGEYYSDPKVRAAADDGDWDTAFKLKNSLKSTDFAERKIDAVHSNITGLGDHYYDNPEINAAANAGDWDTAYKLRNIAALGDYYNNPDVKRAADAGAWDLAFKRMNAAKNPGSTDIDANDTDAGRAALVARLAGSGAILAPAAAELPPGALDGEATTADVNRKNRKIFEPFMDMGITGMSEAVAANNWAVVGALVSNRVNRNNRKIFEPYMGITGMSEAVEAKNWAVAEELAAIQIGRDNRASYEPYMGIRGMSEAVDAKNWAVVDALIDNRVNRSNREIFEPHMDIRGMSEAAVVDALIENRNNARRKAQKTKNLVP